MSGYSTLEVWIIILALGVGTFLIRFSFLGVLGDRDLPPWVLRHLRYTAVGILPAMVTPLVLWPHGAEGGLDPQRIAAAAAALALGLWTKNPIWAVGGGMVMFWCFGWLLG
ncbi:MAG: AzlD domain-containing protein [Roseicyclus sp.]|jgi:branched-subunit amino acid transport protein